MRILVGGIPVHHRGKIQAAAPEVPMLFVDKTDRQGIWERLAKQATHVVLDQSNIAHDHVNYIRKHYTGTIHFSDSKATIRRIIQELDHAATADHRYV